MAQERKFSASVRRPPPGIPRVAVLVDTSTTWGRRIHTGIHNYDRRYGPWQLFVEARGVEEAMRVPSDWRGDGIIARVGNVTVAQKLKALRIPVVNVSAIQVPGVSFPRVTMDLASSAKLAAEHFLESGFRHFAYFSLLGLTYVSAHQQAFAEAVGKAGGDFATYTAQPVVGAEPDWNLDLNRLGRWLKALPRPVGVLTWNPSSAREIIYACQQAQLLVPEEVAVLSTGDDDLLCELLQVPVSGILVPAEQIGYQAAELLARLMRGESPPDEPVLLAPQGVKTRQSTDALAVSDPALVKALSFIRENAMRSIQVTEVARHAGVSRRLLERRFVHALGCTPAHEIRRAHMQRANSLLGQTDMPISDVAEASGFGSPEHFARLFHQQTGKTPLRYRREVRRQ
jgi:LacI family transcriptional regulator